MAKKRASLGTKIDELHDLREHIRAEEAKLNELKSKRSELEQVILDMMDAEEITKSTGNKATVSVSTQTVPNIVDFDKFLNYVYRNKAGHMFERRVSSSAYREALELRKGKDVPGLAPFTKRSINMRSSN